MNCIVQLRALNEKADKIQALVVKCLLKNKLFIVQLSAYLYGHLSHVDTTSHPAEDLSIIQHCFQYVAWVYRPLAGCIFQIDSDLSAEIDV